MTNQQLYPIFVPGIMGTMLREHLDWITFRVWPVPGLMGRLSLNLPDRQGNVNPGAIRPEGILRRVLWSDFYATISHQLAAADSCSMDDFLDKHTFPYDWRLPIETNAALLGEKISQVPQGERVALVAHSMGGLVAKAALRDTTVADRVACLFTLGTPWLGSPDAYVNAVNGLGGLKYEFLAMPSKQTRVSQTFPSVYQLMPSARYYHQATPAPHFYLQKGDAPQRYSDAAGHADRLGYGGYYRQFNAMHLQQWIDQPVVDSVGALIPHCAVVGTGELTTEIARITQSGGVLTTVQVHSGDGRVPYKSAVSVPPTTLVRYVKEEHDSLCSSPAALAWIEWVLQGHDPAAGGMDGFEPAPACAEGEEITALCPVDLLVTDISGQLLAGSLGDYVFNSARDVNVIRIGEDGKHALLPPDCGEYLVTLRGTGIGSLILRHVSYRDGRSCHRSVFWEVPIDSETTFRVKVQNGRCRLLSIRGEDEPIEWPSMPVEEFATDGPLLEVVARVGGRLIAPGAEPTWLPADEQAHLSLEPVGGNGPYRVQIFHDDRWEQSAGHVPIPVGKLSEIRARTMDLMGNTAEATFTVGKTASQPVAWVTIDATPVEDDLYAEPVELYMHITGGVQDERRRCEVRVNNGEVQRLEHGGSLVLPGPEAQPEASYLIRYRATDSAGQRQSWETLTVRVASPASVSAFWVRRAHETEWSEAVRAEAEKGGSIRAAMPEAVIDRVRVGEHQLPIDEPLPLSVSDYSLQIDYRQQGENEPHTTLELVVPRTVRVTRLLPGRSGLSFAYHDTVPVRYKVVPTGEIAWQHRVEAVLVDESGESQNVSLTPHLDPNELAGEIQCKNIHPGQYGLLLRSGPMELSRCQILVR